MSHVKSLLLAAAAAVLPVIAGAATVPVFDANANTNMVVYWGQGPNQQRLAHFCADTNIDIIPVSFVNQFPDQTGGYPGTNFGNQCAATYYKNTDGSVSQLLNSCPDIGPDIKTCQAMGKKILLSLGGAIPHNQHLKSSASATAFATFLWRAFGPDKETSGSTFPRPFGDAAVDGFDFDIENVLASGESSQDLYYGYSTMISSLRGFYAKEPRPYYISGAPQCVVPDAHLANAIQYSHFDFLFVQFYNTAQCSARAYFDHTYGAYGGPATNISFDAWVTFVQKYSNNKGVKVFLGLPASNSNQIVIDSKMYLQPAEAQKIIDAFQCKYPTIFGGVMVYEATFSQTNSINGKPYADVLKGYLMSNKCAAKRTVHPRVVADPPTTPTSCSGDETCYSALTASAPDPTEFCELNDLFGGIPLPNGAGPDCNSASISSACSCLTAAPATSSSTSSATSTSSASSAISNSAVASSSSYTRPSGSPIVSSNSSSHAAGSGTAPYPRSTGTAPSSKSTGTAPYSRSTGTAPPRSGTAPYSRTGTAPFSSGTVPISIKTGTAPGSTSSGTGSLVPSSFFTGSKPIIPSNSMIPYPLTNSSAPATSTEAPSTTESSGASSTGGSGPNQSPASLTDILTTETVTSYTTVCPFTSTISSGGSQIITTGLTTSTVYETSIITVCTRCTAKPTPAPSQSGENSPAVPSSNGGSPASMQEIVTTVIVYTTTTTYPTTQTLTSGGSTITQTTEVVSTVTSTTISTICTKCVPPASKVPAFAPQSPAKTASAGSNGSISPQQPTNTPLNAGSSVPGKQNSPNQGNNSPANSSPAGSLSNPSQAGSNANSPGVGSHPPANVPANSLGSAGGSPASALPKIETLTLVPVPVTATQTEHFTKATQGAESINSAPYPAKNSTSSAGPSGSASPLSSPSPSTLTGPSPFQTSPEAFKGAASRLGVGVGFSIAVALVISFIQ